MVAAPYFGSSATTLIKLRPRSVLVLKFDREAIGSGQVDPREVVKAIRTGVEVHHCSNLHAKVFVFGKTVVVGSANVSQHSERHLLEACVETTDQKLVANARKFIRGLLGDRVGLGYAERMIQFYRPPIRPISIKRRRASKRRTPVHSDLWVISLDEGPWQKVDYEQEKKGLASAEDAVQNPRAFEITDFLWSGDQMPSGFKIGQRVVRFTSTARDNVLVSPPSRIVSIRGYVVKHEKRAIFYLETPKEHRRRKFSAVVRILGSSAKGLGDWSTKRLRDPDLIYRLGRLWSQH